MSIDSARQPTHTTAHLDVNALKALEQAASPAPWLVTDINEGSVHGPAWWIVNDECTNPTDEDGPALGLYLECGVREDAELIAALRNQAPALLTELDRLRDLLEERTRDQYRQRVELRRELDETRAGLKSSNSLIGCLYAAGVEQWDGHAAAVETWRRYEAIAPATVCGRGCTTWCAAGEACPLDAVPRADELPIAAPDPAVVTRSGPCATANCKFCTRDDCGCSCHDVTHAAPAAPVAGTADEQGADGEVV